MSQCYVDDIFYCFCGSENENQTTPQGTSVALVIFIDTLCVPSKDSKVRNETYCSHGATEDKDSKAELLIYAVSSIH